MFTFFRIFAVLIICGVSLFPFAQTAPPTPANCCTLTIVVEGMSSNEGNLGILIFNGPKGWPESRPDSFRDVAVPAQKGTQSVKVNLPPGKYAVALIHDVNQNHKLDKNFVGMPKEQWGMSNNPHATMKAPPISKAMFSLDRDTQIHIRLQ